MSPSGHATPLARSRSRSPQQSVSSSGPPYGLGLLQLRNTSPVSALRAPVEVRRSSLSSVTSQQEVYEAWERSGRAERPEDDRDRTDGSLGGIAPPLGPIAREASPRPILSRNDTSARTITAVGQISKSEAQVQSEGEQGSGNRRSSSERRFLPGELAIGPARHFTSSRSRHGSDRSHKRPSFSSLSRSRQTPHQDAGYDPDDLFEEREREEEIRNKDAFYQERSFTVNEPVGSLSISPSNRDVCLASRKGLFILDMQYTDQAPRKIPQGGTWQVADCQWSPHPSHSNLILTTSSQKLLVWDLLSTSPSTSLSRIIPACNRAVTDINWHATLPDLMATTGIDGSVKVWDLRVKAEGLGMSQATNRFSEWGDAGTQVKWNRQHENILASSHDNFVRIWDTRKGSVPVTTIDAHQGRIYGIDWDRRTRHQIVTCSLDRTIKYWSIDELDRANSSRFNKNPYFPSLPAPQGPDSIIYTNNPVWRARNLPFGSGVLSLPQRGDSSLEMWGKTQEGGPIERFEEYNAPVKDFVWRTRGGQNPGFEDREFQLITWHKDRQLRATPVSIDVLEKAGYVQGAKIDVLVSRRNAPNISYASWDHGLTSTMNMPVATPALEIKENVFSSLPEGRSHRQRTMSLKTTVEAPNTSGVSGKGPPVIIGAKAVMTRGTLGGRTQRSKAVDQLEWIDGITVKRLGRMSASESGGSSVEPSRVASRIRQVAPTLGSWRDRQPLSTLSAAILNRAIAPRGPPRRSSDATEGTEREESASMDMAEEIRRVKRMYPRVKIKGADLDFRKRRCSMGVMGPWGENGHFIYVQAYFRLPISYKDGAAHCEIANNVQMSEDQRQTMQKHLQSICRDNAECLLPCIEYLLATDQRKSRAPAMAEDSGSDSELEQVHQLTPRTSGASFGPDGQLLCFFPKSSATRKRLVSSSRSPNRDEGQGTSIAQLKLLTAMSALSRMSAPLQGRAILPNPSHLPYGNGFSTMLLARSSRGYAIPHDRAVNGVRPSSSLRLQERMIPRLFDPDLARRYRSTGGAVGCDHNAVVAAEAGRDSLSMLWTSLATALTRSTASHPDLRGKHRPFRSLQQDRQNKQATIATAVVRAIFDVLLGNADVQTLAVMLVIVAEWTLLQRYLASQRAEKPDHRPRGSDQDYFQSRSNAIDGRRKTSTSLMKETRDMSGQAEGASLWDGGGRGVASASGFSQIFPGFSSFRSNISGIASRQRQDSEVSAYQPSPEVELARPVSAVKRRSERSASPRKDSFRSQIMSRNADSFSPELEGVSRLRTNPLQRSMSPSEGDMYERSYHRSIGVAASPATKLTGPPARAVSRLGRQIYVASRDSTATHIPWNVVPTSSVARNGVSTLLDPSKLAQYQCWRLAYADMLVRQRMPLQRAEILQLDLYESLGEGLREIRVDTQHPSVKHRGKKAIKTDCLSILSIRKQCEAMDALPSSEKKCWSCEVDNSPTAQPRCIVCRLPAKGLVRSCFMCLHVTHMRCAVDTDSMSDAQCSTGCGCDCTLLGGFQGAFEASLVAGDRPGSQSWSAEEASGGYGAMPSTEEAVDPLTTITPSALSVQKGEGMLSAEAVPKASGGYRAFAKAQVRRMGGETLTNWL